MTRRDVRNIVFAVQLGFVHVLTISVLAGFPLVWPGTIPALVALTAGWWLLLDRRRRP
jgi:hypothetical protein